MSTTGRTTSFKQKHITEDLKEKDKRGNMAIYRRKKYIGFIWLYMDRMLAT